jgi:hypothetical protein
MAKALCFVPRFNRPGLNPATGKPWRDATGAFQPEAEAWRAHLEGRGFEVVSVMVDNKATPFAMRTTVRMALEAHRDLAVVAFFCHGFRSGLQFGIRLASVEGLASDLVDALAPAGVVALYACDAARDMDADRTDDLADGPGGDGGFADRLRDEMHRLGWAGWVDAHASAAHTTKNPHVRRFDHDGRSEYLVQRSHELWQRWQLAVRGKDERSALRVPPPDARGAARRAPRC